MTPFGIYGYIFTKEMTFDLGILTPRFNNLHEIKKKNATESLIYLQVFSLLTQAQIKISLKLSLIFQQF